MKLNTDVKVIFNPKGKFREINMSRRARCCYENTIVSDHFSVERATVTIKVSKILCTMWGSDENELSKIES
jgi:spore coat polysaccharide biosynthesis predicted glycosyltransferase SpsG